jgi:hypothetical protein
MFVILLFGFLIVVDVTHGCDKANNNGYNNYKNVSSVSYILFEHKSGVYLVANLVFNSTMPRYSVTRLNG